MVAMQICVTTIILQEQFGYVGQNADLLKKCDWNLAWFIMLQAESDSFVLFKFLYYNKL